MPEHDIDPQGGILIIYPPQTTPSETRDISVNVQVDGLYVQQDALSVSYDLSARAILIANVIQGRDKFRADYRSQSSIRILLDGLRNPFTNAETDSFQMTTFNFVSGRFYYYIDTVEKGLTFNAECDYPCKTCPSDNPELCTSCYEDLNIKNGLPYL